MTLRQFKSLSKQKQCRVIQYTGVYLASRTWAGMKAELYQVGNFYLEAFYRRPGGEVSFMKVFDSTALLEPYLLGIDLQGLLAHKSS
jgi:hypothetical protein